MKVRLRYFASVRESVGRGAEERDTAASTLSGLRRELVALGAPYAEALATGRAVRMALDQVMADEGTALREGCEVAFFPPVTGG
ncbi:MULTISPECIES: MoaD/ThiS family protein [Ramlibacter]|uniref:Molybdopterin synthase sulfur carrier subunit n=1 Tax=Ramlibacter pinisoli TaxID=2682844 RepID=A0A6N8IN73_9BURK|nr:MULTISPECIES: MoaD/ThiS family protein [Ramlibacter]MBA2963340.1 MoaD/ThiS family protein [Ramlibacter sp. CGMCC 1.13660]MVQ28307.1 molybdopterin synthase sulfur carrier subunit [Ramlibacter pinisoli]